MAIVKCVECYRRFENHQGARRRKPNEIPPPKIEYCHKCQAMFEARVSEVKKPGGLFRITGMTPRYTGGRPSHTRENGSHYFPEIYSARNHKGRKLG